jgi:hypothetical protein
MTFLNMILLGGLIAGGIPIIIHIINRNRFRKVPWGAMHLLEQILRIRRRRLKIEQLILLLVRICIPVLLALCMARPVLTGMQALLGKAKTSVVFLLDNSYSMNALATTNSQFAEAKREINSIMNALPRGSEVTVTWMTGRQSGRIGPTFDRGRVRGSLASKKKGFGMADATAGLQTAAGLFTKAHYVDRELIVVSDFQKISWDEPTAGSRRRSLELIENLPIEPRITLLRVGREVEDNIAVESLSLSRPVLGVGQTVRIRGDIKNYGKNTVSDIRVYFRVNGKNRSASQISLGAGESSQVIFSHAFDTPGSQVVEIYADADPLTADNVKRYSIPVWDQLPVLLVSGDTTPGALQSETAFLEIALQPFASAASQLADLIRVKVITADKLDAQQFMIHRVVVLANVRQLTDLQVKLLGDFVRLGGGLLVFGGDRINAEWYNAKLIASGQGVLPCDFGETIQTTISMDDREGLSPANLVARHYEHESLELFNDPRNGSLETITVHTWHKLAPDELNPEQITTLAHLDTGDAFLMEKEYGEGRAIQCCTACDDDWSNLPMRPCYLPLMQQLVTYLASKVHPPRNVEVGEQLAAILPVVSAGRIAVMTDPEGRRHELKASLKDNYSIVEFGSTERPGLYVLETPDKETIHFVVNTSCEESDLKLLSDEEFSELADQMHAEAVTSAGEFLELDKVRRFGREIWKSILAAVLVLIFVEMLLQQRFARAKV